MSLRAVAASLLVLSACSSTGEEAVEGSEDALQSPPLADADMKPIARPPGMPAVWAQPDSEGTFGERGKCGPTAVANLLRLYGTEASPDTVDDQGVHWWIGTRGVSIRDWFAEAHPELGCTLEHPTDGPKFLREELAGGHPVLVWFNMEGGLQSHWVTVVGVRGSGAGEEVVVMSWGRYYATSMKKLDDAWRNVYWVRRPSIVCSARAKPVPPR